MPSPRLFVVVPAALAAAAVPSPALAGDEIETFAKGQFTNPFFVHQFDPQRAGWSIEVGPFQGPGDYSLHLDLNDWRADFNVGPGRRVDRASLLLYDTETGFAGTPVTAVIFHGVNDYAFFNAQRERVPEVIECTESTPGLLTGLPIGPLVAIVVQAGGPSDGAYLDDITARVVATCYPDCDTTTGVGVLDIFDFLCFQNRYDAGSPYACDCDTSTGGGVCDIFDFLCFQNAFGGGCP